MNTQEISKLAITWLVLQLVKPEMEAYCQCYPILYAVCYFMYVFLITFVAMISLSFLESLILRNIK